MKKYREVLTNPTDKDFHDQWKAVLTPIQNTKFVFHIGSGMTGIWATKSIIDSQFGMLEGIPYYLVLAIASIFAIVLFEKYGEKFLASAIDSILWLNINSPMAFVMVIFTLGTAGAIYKGSLSYSRDLQAESIKMKAIDDAHRPETVNLNKDKAAALSAVRTTFDTKRANSDTSFIRLIRASNIQYDKKIDKCEAKIKHYKSLPDDWASGWVTKYTNRKLNSNTTKAKKAEALENQKAAAISRLDSLQGVAEKAIDREFGGQIKTVLVRSASINTSKQQFYDLLSNVFSFIVLIFVIGIPILIFMQRCFYRGAGIKVSYVFIGEEPNLMEMFGAVIGSWTMLIGANFAYYISPPKEWVDSVNEMAKTTNKTEEKTAKETATNQSQREPQPFPKTTNKTDKTNKNKNGKTEKKETKTDKPRTDKTDKSKTNNQNETDTQNDTKKESKPQSVPKEISDPKTVKHINKTTGEVQYKSMTEIRTNIATYRRKLKKGSTSERETGLKYWLEKQEELLKQMNDYAKSKK